MPDSFDAFHYIGYMRSRGRWIGASCVVAVALALAVSLAQTRLYTATARIVIEPPAGSDLRSAMAVSPIYLESLKTYEQFASSDSLFRKAIDQFDLRASLGSRPIESLKRRVLQVGIVRNTRILEIEATLPDPRKAQTLAHFMAQSAVELNRSLVSEGDQDLIHGIEQQQHDARAHLQEIEDAWAKVLSNEPVNQLQSAIESAAELRAATEQQVLNTELEIADAAQREKQASGSDAAEIRKQAGDARARLDEMRKQLQALDSQAAEREKLLAQRLARRDKLEADRKGAQASITAIESRLREARGDAGYRGERLKIIDPGIVPERPSSPNLPLNLAAALLLGLVLPILYFTLEMSYRERTIYREFSKARHE
ncbi:Lipopolysaccharide biosynthesis [Candidatus Sulfopaludibacter sp. SbA4]|nr:Lipopolysaccharide biosynthesis [Candidatus Sulfopaludibacter sp. SbA4]